MTEPIKVKAKVIDASYNKEAQSVLMLLECEQGKFRSQIHRNQIATFGNRTEEEIEKEMEKYVDILKYSYVGRDKYVTAIFDTELDKKLKDNYKLKY